MFFSKFARAFSRILRKASSKWAKDFDLMIRRDKIDADDIAEVIDWSQNDNFWRSNILSGKKVREKYQKSKRWDGWPRWTIRVRSSIEKFKLTHANKT